MNFSNKPSSVVIVFCLCALISTQQVHTGPAWSSPPKYQTLTPKENQDLEKQKQRMREQEMTVIPDVPQEINTPLELIKVQVIRDVVLPSREQEYETMVRQSDQRLEADMAARVQVHSHILDHLCENFSTVFSPPCSDHTKPISVDEQERCKEIREKIRHTLLALRDGVQEAKSLAEDSQVSANERKKARDIFADRKRQANYVLNQYKAEFE